MSFFPLIYLSSKEDIKGDGIARPDLHVVTVLLTSKRIVLIMIRSRVPVQVYCGGWTSSWILAGQQVNLFESVGRGGMKKGKAQ